MTEVERQGFRLERRADVRRSHREKVRVSLPAQTIRGLSRDLSGSGAFLFTGDDILVDVIFGEGEQEGYTAKAKLVRYESVPGGGVGFAVEFLGPEEHTD